MTPNQAKLLVMSDQWQLNAICCLKQSLKWKRTISIKKHKQPDSQIIFIACSVYLTFIILHCSKMQGQIWTNGYRLILMHTAVTNT